MKLSNILSVITLILIIIIIYIIMYKVSKNMEKFVANNNSENDGNMKFDYLTDPINYKNNALKYYLNDDSIINNNRVVKHPYQKKRGKYYGNPLFYKNDTDVKLSRLLYNITGLYI